MKKAKLFLISFAFVSFAFTSDKDTNQDTPINVDDTYGRQCCSKSAFAYGALVTVTACSGNFLSNNVKSMTKACTKATKALMELGIQ